MRRKTQRIVFWLAVLNAFMLYTATFFPLFLPMEFGNWGRPNLFIFLTLIIDFIGFPAYIRFLWLLRPKMVPIFTNVKRGHTHISKPNLVIPAMMTRGEMKAERPLFEFGRDIVKAIYGSDCAPVDIYEALDLWNVSDRKAKPMTLIRTFNWIDAMNAWCKSIGKPNVGYWWSYMMVNKVAVEFDEGTQIGRIQGSGDTIFIHPESMMHCTSHSISVYAKLVPYRGIYEREIPMLLRSHIFRYQPKRYEYGRVTLCWGFMPDERYVTVLWPKSAPGGGRALDGFTFDKDGIICPERIEIAVERERSNVEEFASLIKSIVDGAINDMNKLTDQKTEWVKTTLEKKRQPEQTQQPPQQTQPQGGANSGRS